MIWEDILPKMITRRRPGSTLEYTDNDMTECEENTIAYCVKHLKEAESEGKVALNPPSEEEIELILQDRNLIDYSFVGGRILSTQKVATAISRRIREGR